MITSGYTMELICDCRRCKSTDNPYEIARTEYAGESYSECAKQAREDGWTLSRNRAYCSAPKHRKAEKE